MTERGTFPFTVARFRDLQAERLIAMADEADLKAALIYMPDACRVARLTSSGFEVFDCRSGKSKQGDLASAYEVRAFGTKAELRWTRAGDTGEAMMLADAHRAVPQAQDPPQYDSAIARLTRTYLVWGKADAGSIANGGWTALNTGRIGTIHVPWSGPAVTELRLKAYEYVVRGAHGNAAVLFERLVQFDDVQTGGERDVRAAEG